MGLNSLDFWRLADEFCVVDAAILITGNDPSERFDISDENGHAVRDANGVWRTAQRRDYTGFEATFKSLKIAIRANKLRATTRHFVNRAEYKYVADYGDFPLDQGPGFTRMSYDFMVSRKPGDTGQTVLNFSVDELRGCNDFFV
jgi:hypothetical protein